MTRSCSPFITAASEELARQMPHHDGFQPIEIASVKRLRAGHLPWAEVAYQPRLWGFHDTRRLVDRGRRVSSSYWEKRRLASGCSDPPWLCGIPTDRKSGTSFPFGWRYPARRGTDRRRRGTTWQANRRTPGGQAATSSGVPVEARGQNRPGSGGQQKVADRH